MCKDANREQDAIADERVEFVKQLSDMEQALMAKQAERDRLVQQASNG
jgi:hypothetical protein